MPFCPKCEQEFRAGFTRCHDCGVDLVAHLPKFAARAEAEEDFAEEMFAAEETVWVCPSCYNLFVADARTCAPCGQARIEEIPLSSYHSLWEKSLLERFSKFEVPEVILGLKRVKITSSPVEANFLAASLREMGVTVTIGNDVLDDFGDDSRVGLYVPLDEVESASMLLRDDEPIVEETRTGGTRPYDRLLREAQGYREIQKFRQAQHLLARAIELEPASPTAYLHVARLLGSTGHLDKALEVLDEAIDLLGRDDHTDARFLYGVYSFLRPGGEVSFDGGIGERGFLALRSYVQREPRKMAALMLLFEAAMRRGNKETARAARDQMRRLNRAAFKDPGLYQDLLKELGE